MDAASFDELLTGDLSTSLSYEQAHRCPCLNHEGYAEKQCPVCKGIGVFYDAASAPFQAGLIGQDMKALEAMVQKFGPGAVGDAVLVLPGSAPCWSTIGSRDRLTDLMALDRFEWTVIPNSPVTIPPGFVPGTALVRNVAQARLDPVAWPTPNASGKIVVMVPTVLRFQAPRRYLVLDDLSRHRSFTAGLPKRIGLKLIETTTR